MKVVVDASVAIKWIVSEKTGEPDIAQATNLLAAIDVRGFEAIAPPHWGAEVLAVIARLSPDRIDATLRLLRELNPKVDTSDKTLARAARMSADLNHHLFDTWYHAVAIEVDATFVTADERYFNKARNLGHIQLLRDFVLPTGA